PFYQTQILSDPNHNGSYVIIPKVDRIRAAVRDAFTADQTILDRREAITAEGASVYVLNGAHQAGQATGIADYLEFLGMAAAAPAQKPDVSGLAATTIRVYNGAETSDPLTVAALQGIFGVQAQLLTDPSAVADIVIITGANTPSLTPPPIP